MLSSRNKACLFCSIFCSPNFSAGFFKSLANLFKISQVDFILNTMMVMSMSNLNWSHRWRRQSLSRILHIWRDKQVVFQMQIILHNLVDRCKCTLAPRINDVIRVERVVNWWGVGCRGKVCVFTRSVVLVKSMVKIWSNHI